MLHRFLSRYAPSRPTLRRVFGMAYPLFAGWLVLYVARLFYGEMLTQTGGEWSAPLDDVFIHFDFARSTARGYPFQWSEGNGYSSGNTSLTYPFVLALGYWVVFRDTYLMVWAAIVACCCVFAFLLVVPRLARGLPPSARFLLPIAVFSVGALSWSLFSGMEVAWFLAVIALLSPRTRASAAILLSSAVSFLLLVAMNGQVRWQNERYTMPAVAWLLVAAALGLGVLLFRPRSVLPPLTAVPRLTLAVAAVVAFVIVQTPRTRDQISFFARASRNIRDQHITTGRLLRHHMRPPPHRVLVGDAGAIIYASDLPGLDIIGLGGFRGLPFARASSHGPGAIIELIERIPPEDRPDVFAIYPSWWDVIPIWFGKQIATVPVEGNVICGGNEKVI
ncbi:MAG: hypothetical protein CVU63_13475 [Deltaproteobacteria bacterium HGW-Deltaproteobacteria-20]|nr:MAG: hypothetical protein CVU63_13475 [Deltaproteobacteria bacterium HGW-Deltaproteobacteria-20]